MSLSHYSSFKFVLNEKHLITSYPLAYVQHAMRYIDMWLEIDDNMSEHLSKLLNQLTKRRLSKRKNNKKHGKMMLEDMISIANIDVSNFYTHL
jgi:hypothetical protein